MAILAKKKAIDINLTSDHFFLYICCKLMVIPSSKQATNYNDVFFLNSVDMLTFLSFVCTSTD